MSEHDEFSPDMDEVAAHLAAEAREWGDEEFEMFVRTGLARREEVLAAGGVHPLLVSDFGFKTVEVRFQLGRLEHAGPRARNSARWVLWMAIQDWRGDPGYSDHWILNHNTGMPYRPRPR